MEKNVIKYTKDQLPYCSIVTRLHLRLVSKHTLPDVLSPRIALLMCGTVR